MWRKSILYTVAALIVIVSVSAVSVSADVMSEGKIGYSEAWDLVKRSYELYMNICNSDRCPANLRNNLIYGGPERILKTVNEVREYAKTIYTEELADYALLYKEKYRQMLERNESGSVVQFKEAFPTDNIDELRSSFAQYYCYFYISKSIYDSYSGVFPDPEEVFFTEKSNNNGRAEFSLIVQELSGPGSELVMPKPGRVNVTFRQTSNGWRIDECGYFFGIIEGNRGINVKELSGFEPVFPDVELYRGVFGTLVTESGSQIDVSEAKISMRETDKYKTFKDAVVKSAKLITIQKDRVHVAVDWYEIYNEKTDKWESPLIDAEFDYRYDDNKPYAVLVGGELYRIMNGATRYTPYTGPIIILTPVDSTNNPDTGDAAQFLYSSFLASLICTVLCARAAVRKKSAEL